MPPGRSLKEWIAASPDTAVPPRVKLRIYEKFKGRCATCEGKIITGPQYDHIIPLVLGGENRETNLQLLCKGCHQIKTGVDVAQKSLERRKKAKHLGIKTKTTRPIMGSKASGWKRGFDGIWKRR